MTRPESRLPGRPDERAASRSSAPGGCADPLLGLLLVVAEAAGGALLALWLGLRGLARSRAHEMPADKGVSASPPADPGTDWTPAIAIGVFALVVACLAVALLRGRWHWAGGMQVVVALALGAMILAGVVEEGSRKPPEPAPTWNSPPCRSGGDNSECARSGG
ncbi:DUF6234 family protein [Streptomyces anulatus]|uniref:DUF6234 family protein n=1 Tax=Streptomyces anulatus TaxID=1892 RepID=UPI002ECFFBB1|nr:DUF6234 family protein [Streptomyces anulatus]